MKFIEILESSVIFIENDKIFSYDSYDLVEWNLVGRIEIEGKDVNVDILNSYEFNFVEVLNSGDYFFEIVIVVLENRNFK